ncbi:MAG TPA: sigma-70 family RNA polymerase sigma factor, partial [Candidatus Limnocylindria bacterium]|nr:sigma-70 family RNA polymerase sigma factor [Candidatus Limnocylindria bacterium]
LDTTYLLRYNAQAVSGDKVRNSERERLGSEIMIYLDHLYRVAFYLAKNEEDAHDCVQETCARALNAHLQFTAGTNLKAWLTRILYNCFFDSLARHKRTVSFNEPRGDAAREARDWENFATEEAGPEKRLLQKELSVKINEALKHIPAEFRAPIVLVDMGEFSYQEAAEILNCPIGTVRSRLSRGRKLLANFMGGYLQ